MFYLYFAKSKIGLSRTRFFVRFIIL